MKDETPAWLLCQDILIRGKEELVSEAIETLDGEMKGKRMDIIGDLVTASEETGGIERKLFIINNIMEHERDIWEKYNASIDALETRPESMSPKTVERIEELKKFLLAITQISMLMKYSRVLDQWFEDIGLHFKEKDPVKIFSDTINGEHRLEALQFLTTSKRMAAERLFSAHELSIMKEATGKYRQSR